VGDACYIGPQSIITAGVTVGSHCLIGALSLVKENIPDYSFVGGIPAELLGRVQVDADANVRLIHIK
jgi:acetyltransferase-like isoleucine patch superfamily enzyme